MLLQEERVLEQRQALPQNPDDWPTFNFERITVFSQKTGEKTSLLSAHTDNPVKVTGTLEEVDSGLQHLVRDKKYRDLPIKINNVTMYAFAECEDASYVFWAAGKSGWFELQGPARSFKPIYNKMEEAASIFYMLADKLRRSHNRKRKLNANNLSRYATQVFEDYLAYKGTSVHFADIDDVREAFHSHREFLITSMIEGQDGLDWADTPMWSYFKLMFSDDFAKIEARILGKDGPVQADVENNSDQSKKRKSQSPHTDGNQAKIRKKGRPTVSEAKQQQPITPVNSSSIDVSSSSEDAGGNPNVITRKRKSILQPSGGKFSKKAAARRRSLAATQDRDDSQQDEGEGVLDVTEDSPITTIRNAKDLELLTNPPSNRSPDATPSPKFLPRKYLELKVVEYDLPSIEAQGPGDLWTCTFEGCFHRIHEASTATGKKRIKDHFKTHATQAQEKINLALDESRPYLPVDNLVRRLQSFAPPPGVEPSLDSLERKFSAPIRRKY